MALRREYGWGARKLQVLLAREGIALGETTINRIIKRNGLIRREGAHRPALTRFEHEHPNDMWQMDFKGHIRLNEQGRCYPLSILDDHSRFLIGLFALDSTRTKPVLSCLEQVFGQYGLPRVILTDRGSPFWSTTNLLGLTQVSVFILRQGVRLARSAVRHPQTQGKVERFHRTLKDEMIHQGTPRTMGASHTFFAAFRQRYNYVRPHEALDMDVPAQHYAPSERRYNPIPPPWPYPSEMSVVQLNTQGHLEYGGQRLSLIHISEPTRPY